MPVIESVWILGSGLSLLAVGIVGCCTSQQQQQQRVTIEEAEKLKRICPECGIENPEEASHCGDCGFSFTSGDKDE